MSDAERLARIENKLDEMSKAIVALARVEERLSLMYAAHERHAQRLQVLEVHIHKLDNVADANGTAVRFGERLFWMTVAAAGSILTYYLQQGNWGS